MIEYEPGTHFLGIIGRTLDESSPAWPRPTRAGEGSLNVIFFILDDVGYGQMSVFGGLCETPNLEKLANRGLRYTNMQTTALCSPTGTATGDTASTSRTGTCITSTTTRGLKSS